MGGKAVESKDDEPMELTADAEETLYKSAKLRTSCAQNVLHYAQATAALLPAWWRSALQRSQRRSRLGVFMGKRRVLDSFVSKVLSRASTVVAEDPQLRGKNVALQVAYGQAGLTMSSTGKGELAVPTAGMFKAVKRVCSATDAAKPSNVLRCLPVKVTDEWGTTKYDMESGGPKRKVHRVITMEKSSTTGKVELRSKAVPCQLQQDGSSSAGPPPVPRGAQQAVALWCKREKQRAARRREGGSRQDEGRRSAQRRADGLWCLEKEMADLTEEDVMKAGQYPEVRGLQANQAGKFVAQDKASAVAIGMCRVMKLLGKGRPAPFCRPRNKT